MCSEVRLGVNDLRATVPFTKMELASAEDLWYHKKVVKLLVIPMIQDLEEAMDAYAAKEYDQEEVDKVFLSSNNF